MRVALNQSPSLIAKVARRAFTLLMCCVAGKGDAAELVAGALFNRHQNIDALAAIGPEGEPVKAAFVANLGTGRFDGRVGVALVAVGQADALGVFVELGSVEGAGEQILENDGIRDADGLQVLHRAAQVKAAQVLIAGELDLADFDRRAFLDIEVDLHRGGRNGFDVSLDDGELVAVLGEQLCQYRLGTHHLGGVVLALNGEADLFLFEAVENVGC